MKYLRKTTSILAILTLLTITTGCSVRHGDFTVLSNKTVRLSEFELDQENITRNVIGKDVAHIIFLFPTKGTVTLEEAIDNALYNGDGDVMTDAVVKSWGFYIPYIYGQFGWEVKGDVVKTRKH